MPLLDNPFSLTGRSAVVTGAGSGIGRGIALVLASQGAKVWVADVNSAGADATVADIRERGWDAESASLDVTDADAAHALADSVAEAHGSLDIWVNNAGITADGPPSTVDDDELLRIWKVNFLGVVHGSQAAARLMAEQERKGAIVNITTGGVDRAMVTVAAYTSSKAAAHQYSRSLALELGATGVRVNTVAAGWVETGITRRHYGEGVDRERDLQAKLERTPLGFIGDEFDQGYAVLYLVSDAARFVTGAVLRPNGGTSMQW
ncbi:SDR family NAD(P)-dependent oxidoreductase [Agromyces sp. Marseille-P2726]|uniref:SDR family NAD(P)-dependent oxidoreductase n=1 Tax=Agromyces sp. Marseille-P2726 TaxID=2709132 RepID=UPI001570216F|nr:SDR family oxidoreductase [Agromyces sp. Marseille-P2726]